MGVAAVAAVATINPIYYLCFALFAGFAKAAGVINGHSLGAARFEQAWQQAWWLILITAIWLEPPLKKGKHHNGTYWVVPKADLFETKAQLKELARRH